MKLLEKPAKFVHRELLGRMARTEAPHNQERRPRRTDGRGERRTVAETVGREGRREELGNLVVSRWGASKRWAPA